VIRLGEYTRLFVDIDEYAQKENISRSKSIKHQEEKFDDIREDFNKEFEKWKNIFSEWNEALKKSEQKIISNYISS
jgi:hypothetical protein